MIGKAGVYKRLAELKFAPDAAECTPLCICLMLRKR